MPSSFSDWLRTNRTSFTSTVPTLRLVPVASCHITLRFLGELPDEQIDDVVERLSLLATPGTSVVLDRFGVFRRDGHPTILLSGLGSNGRTERFAPHVTLGRFAPGTRDDEVAAIEAGSVEPFVVPVADVVLYESIMGQGHPVYIARASVRLVPFAE